MVLGQLFRDFAPLLHVVSRSEGVEQYDRGPLAEFLEGELAELPGVAVAATPTGAFEPSAGAGDQGVGESGQADRGAAQEEPTDQALAPPSLLLLLGSPGGHEGQKNSTPGSRESLACRSCRLESQTGSGHGKRADRGVGGSTSP